MSLLRGPLSGGVAVDSTLRPGSGADAVGFEEA